MKILIVDDEKAIVDLMRRSLMMEGYETVCAFCGEEAIHKVEVERPDIILLDIRMPDMDGYEVLQRIQEFDETIPVIFITAHDKRYNKILGLELGADDFISKPFDIKELVLKIKAIWRRMNYGRVKQEQPGKVISLETMEINPVLRKVFVDGEARELTFKEFDTIYFLVSHYAQVFTREQLINEIWGFDYMGNTRAVDILIKRLRSKMEPYGKYIQTVYGVGYRFEVKKDEEE